MRNQSADYNPFPRVREVDCRITFGIMDQNAKNAGITKDAAGYIDNAKQTVDGKEEIAAKWATFEDRFWVLDGTFDIAPDNFKSLQTGYWTYAISDSNGDFPEGRYPYIRYTFAQPITTMGWTLVYDAKAMQYPSTVIVTVFDANRNQMGRYTFSETGSTHIYRQYVAGYSSVRFEFVKTSEPQRRVRLIETNFGITQNFDRNSIGTAEMIYGVSADASSLPTRELVFTFDNSDKMYNLLNPDGVYQHLQDGQVITARIVIGGEDVDMGTFYFSSADASKSAILPTITAHDRIYALDGREFDGGRDEEVMLSEAVSEVLDGYDIPVKYDEAAKLRPVHMSIPARTKVREAVRMLVQAARCTAYIDRDGSLQIRDLTLKDAPDGYITVDELYDYSGVSVSRRIDGVRLTVKDDFRPGKDGTPGRQITYYTGSGEQIKGYSNPCVADSEGQAVCDWLYSVSGMLKKYAVRNRCDPSVEVGDTLNIADAYGNLENAIVTGIDIVFGQSLSATTEAIGK